MSFCFFVFDPQRTLIFKERFHNHKRRMVHQAQDGEKPVTVVTTHSIPKASGNCLTLVTQWNIEQEEKHGLPGDS